MGDGIVLGGGYSGDRYCRYVSRYIGARYCCCGRWCSSEIYCCGRYCSGERWCIDGRVLGPVLIHHEKQYYPDKPGITS